MSFFHYKSGFLLPTVYVELPAKEKFRVKGNIINMYTYGQLVS